MTIQETKQFIAAADLCDQAPLIESLHGIGKSSIVNQYAQENNMHCETLILSLLDVGDLLGLPRTAEVGGQSSTVWSAPQWFSNIVNEAMPSEMAFDDIEFKDSNFKEYVVSRLDAKAPVDRGHLNAIYCNYINITNDRLHIVTQDLCKYKYARRSVLFLDEMNRTAQDILNASLQLVLDKRLHTHILPRIDGKPTLVIAAINPADTGDYTTNSMDPALQDRFIYGSVDPDIKSWVKWANSTNLEKVVVDFLLEHPDRLHYTSKDGKSSATPRSWASLAKTMANIDQIPQEVQFQVMKGLVGQELASQFLAYYNNYAKVIKMEDIEAFIDKKVKRTTDISKIGKDVKKLIKDQEAIQKSELAEQFYQKYTKFDDAQDALPLIAFLSGLELETLNGFLKSKKSDDFENYMKLAKFDGVLNSKRLFTSITTKISK
jgi:hypothetical protein